MDRVFLAHCQPKATVRRSCDLTTPPSHDGNSDGQIRDNNRKEIQHRMGISQHPARAEVPASRDGCPALALQQQHGPASEQHPRTPAIP